ncbi:hypothetical protein VP01_7764g1, partial [Puccinia sorghi]
PHKLALLSESHVIRHFALKVLLKTPHFWSRMLEYARCIFTNWQPWSNGQAASSTEVVDITQRILIGKCIHRTPYGNNHCRHLPISTRSITLTSGNYFGANSICVFGIPQRSTLLLEYSQPFTDQAEFRCTHKDKVIDPFSSDFRNLTLEAALEVTVIIAQLESLEYRLDIQKLRGSFGRSSIAKSC